MHNQCGVFRCVQIVAHQQTGLLQQTGCGVNAGLGQGDVTILFIFFIIIGPQLRDHGVNLGVQFTGILGRARND